jgi:hypothetical protein
MAVKVYLASRNSRDVHDRVNGAYIARKRQSALGASLTLRVTVWPLPN